MTLKFDLRPVLLAAAAAACITLPSAAADLGGWPGSMKDTFEARRATAGPCYFRTDVGYSLSNNPNISWGNQAVISNERMDDTFLVEGGFGCGSGARGWRAELMLGYRGDRDIQAHVDLPAQTIDDPLHTTLTTYTLMSNVYYDLGNWNRLTPYVGAGIGMAYHMVEDVYFTGNPALVNRIHGDRDLAFAWSLMAGFGYQLSDRVTLDLGYRYIDLGKATSERLDSGGNPNPRVVIDDITAHEFKVGLRYAFGGGECCAALK